MHSARNSTSSSGSGSKNPRNAKRGSRHLLPTLTGTRKGSSCGGTATLRTHNCEPRDNRPIGKFSINVGSSVIVAEIRAKRRSRPLPAHSVLLLLVQNATRFPTPRIKSPRASRTRSPRPYSTTARGRAPPRIPIAGAAPAEPRLALAQPQEGNPVGAEARAS